MRDRQGSRWGPAAAVAFLLLSLLLAYPLSLGPVVLAFDLLGEPEWMLPLEVVYEPLDGLPEPLESMLDRYVDVWSQ